jgi:putative chitinase
MSLKSLQEKIGVTADGDFGPGTIKAAMKFYKLTPIRAAHFFGQVAHETGGFKTFTENLNYSAGGLKETFKKYFPGNLSDLYTRQPEKIANHVYANRMGNRDEASGDGWKYRGRGALQTTGKSNYMDLAKHLAIPSILATPDLVATDYAFESALFFFESNNLWSICDQGIEDNLKNPKRPITPILSLTKKINGGTNGLEDRILLTKKYYGYVK